MKSPLCGGGSGVSSVSSAEAQTFRRRGLGTGLVAMTSCTVPCTCGLELGHRAWF